MIERTEKEWEDYWKQLKKCPICDQSYITNCNCLRSDSICPNGHEWHNCTVHNIIVLGLSDHSLETDVCTCLKTIVKAIPED